MIDIWHWWCILRMSCGSWFAIIASFYFRLALDLSVLLDLLKPILHDILARFPNDVIVLGSQFNARVGVVDHLGPEIFYSTHLFASRESSDNLVNDHGPLLL